MADTRREVEVDVVAKPIPVHVVRPARSWGDFASMLIAGALTSLVVAWALMLIAEEVTDWGLGYLDALLILVAARLLQVGSGSKLWTHKAKGSAL